jgi:hypothetical protein
LNDTYEIKVSDLYFGNEFVIVDFYDDDDDIINLTRTWKALKIFWKFEMKYVWW